MVLVTIALETAEDETRLLAFLPTVSGRVVAKIEDSPVQSQVTEEETAAKRERLRNAMDRLGKSSCIAETFGDASEWQREIRSWDRVLYGREE